MTRLLVNDQATQALGVALSRHARAPLIVYLSGPLGAGKSTLVRALLRNLGVTGAIKSPSYTLVELYRISSYSIYHFDFYRFFDESEWEESGFRECFQEHAFCLVEWPEKARSVLPEADLEIRLSYTQKDGELALGGCRLATLFAGTVKGTHALELLEEEIKP